MIPNFHLKQHKGVLTLKKMLAKRILDKKKMEIKDSVWQGNIVSHTLYEETVELSESGTVERILYWEG